MCLLLVQSCPAVRLGTCRRLWVNGELGNGQYKWHARGRVGLAIRRGRRRREQTCSCSAAAGCSSSSSKAPELGRDRTLASLCHCGPAACCLQMWWVGPLDVSVGGLFCFLVELRTSLRTSQSQSQSHRPTPTPRRRNDCCSVSVSLLCSYRQQQLQVERITDERHPRPDRL